MTPTTHYDRWQKAIAEGKLDPLKAGDRPPILYKEFGVQVEAMPDDRRCRFTITTEDADRERDVVKAEGVNIANFQANPVVLFAHDYKSLPVGRAISIERYPGKIVAVTEFATADLNPFAEQVYRMVKAGFLKACSIGFRPLEWVYDEDRKGVNFEKSELLEYSIVPVPANAQALIAAGIDSSVVKGWAERVLADLAAHPDQMPRAGAPDANDFSIADVRDAFRHVEDPGVFVEKTRSGDTFRVYASSGEVRWNRQLSKSFDVTQEQFQAQSVEQAIAAKYCGCEIKALHHRHERVRSARMGAFLVALDATVAETVVDDVRNLDDHGREAPPLYERIQLNSTRAEEFLIDGLRFLQWNGVKIAVRVEPRWFGLQVTTYAARAHADAARSIVDKTLAHAKTLNFLKGEAFTLGGEFLSRDGADFDGLFLPAKNMQAVRRIVTLLNDKGAEMENRGVILLGPPGTGKTLSARILKDQARATFIWVSARDFWYSGGMQGMADTFDMARECAPTIICFEDVDNYLDGYTTDLMKTEMDGLAQSRGVVTLLTTNYPEHLPKALIDRPGRFHDVLRFDLPDAAVRKAMLARWMPDLTGSFADKVVEELKGYSGAHVREFARFAAIIREQESLSVSESALAALEKLKEQRDLITSVQAQGSRYRAPEHVAEKAAAPGREALLAAAQTDGTPRFSFAKDLPGWKAFTKARDRATKVGVLTADRIAELLSDYGFETEARAIAADPVVDALFEATLVVRAHGFEVVEVPGAKAGRVLSKANETRVRNARDAAEMIRTHLDEVLSTVGREPEPETQTEPEVALAIADEPQADDAPPLAIADEPEPVALVDPDLLREAVAAGLREVVERETRAAVAAARGRLD